MSTGIYENDKLPKATPLEKLREMTSIVRTSHKLEHLGLP